MRVHSFIQLIRFCRFLRSSGPRVREAVPFLDVEEDEEEALEAVSAGSSPLKAAVEEEELERQDEQNVSE